MAMSRADRRKAEKLAKKKGGASSAEALNALMQQAVAHYKANRLPQALKALEKVLDVEKGRPEIFANAGMIAYDLGKMESAARNYGSAVAIAPDDAKTQFGLALSEKSLGHFDKAAKAAREAVKLSGGAPEPLRSLIQLLWQTGETADVPDLCQTLLSHEPQNIEAAMYEAMAHYHQGNGEEARAILGFDDLVEIHDLDAPDGYDDMAAFNKALADHVVDHPTMAVPDKDHPTYHNDELHITRELVGPGASTEPGPIRDLEVMIAAKVDDYLTRKRAALSHPFFDRWPEKSHLTAWGTLLKGRGNLASHIHLDGYLGMVYYPELPDEMRSDAADSGEDTSGFLELGHLPDDFPVSLDVDTHTIQPKEGRLVMFPGYFFHRTVPFESKDRRISIAFDVVADKV
ncbi:MAG: putative 2OG-Fe(II) oxygenase [Pseudomonadota bacterium]